MKLMFRDNFPLQHAIRRFDLNPIESAFCESLPPATPKPEFLNIFEQYLSLAQGVKSKKAKSELLVSPILVELLQLADNRVQLFSGEEFTIDKERNTICSCDFLLNRSTISSIIQAPILMVVEVSIGELDVTLGKCAAKMLSAQVFNSNENKPIPIIYGCVTSGNSWQFLKLENDDITLDLNEYPVTPVERILGILNWMVSCRDPQY
jgi:hypothetical protein